MLYKLLFGMVCKSVNNRMHVNVYPNNTYLPSLISVVHVNNEPDGSIDSDTTTPINYAQILST